MEPVFSSRDYDEYDASQMNNKSLQYHISEHEEDCECAYCDEFNSREENALKGI